MSLYSSSFSQILNNLKRLFLSVFSNKIKLSQLSQSYSLIFADTSNSEYVL